MYQTVTQQNNVSPEVVNAALEEAKAEEGNKKVFDTRFGEIEMSLDNPIIFPQGLLGIAGNFEYVLTDFPSEKLSEFKLLQSLNDPTVSFITMPLPVDNRLIEKEDLVKAAGDVGVDDVENLTVLLIVSVHRSPLEKKISVNARAPLLVYVPNRTAVQYVFQNSKYQVQTMLTMDSE